MRVAGRVALESRASLSLLLFALLLLCGCDDSGGDYEGSLAGISYYEGIRSEMGMGPDGAIYDYALLDFADDTHMYWYHSDLAEYGTYQMTDERSVTLTFKQMFDSQESPAVFVCALENLQRVAVCEFGTFYTPAVHPDENL